MPAIRVQDKFPHRVWYGMVWYGILFVHFKIDHFVIALQEMASFVFVL